MDSSVASSSFRKSNKAHTRGVALSAIFLVLGTSILLPGASPAFATASCPVGSTQVSSGVCEVVFTSTPGSAWTPPAGIEKLQALLVGAGGTGDDSYSGYGGGGGDVRVVALSTTGAVTVTVGQAGTGAYSAANDSTVAQGGVTETAEGGRPGNDPVDYGGTSGNGNGGWYGGGGAGGATNDADGGNGVVVNSIQILGEPTLFSDVSTCYGGGGGAGWYVDHGGGVDNNLGSATCGAGYFTYDLVEGLIETGPLANSGSGGAAVLLSLVVNLSDNYSHPGAAGKVALRFSFPDGNSSGGSNELAQTGATGVMSTIFGAGMLALAGVSAVAAATGLRLRRSRS